MQMTGIDATLRQLVEQLPTGQTRTKATDTFRSLIESLGTQIKASIEEASSRPGSSHAATPATPATPASPDLPAVATAHRLRAFQ